MSDDSQSNPKTESASNRDAERTKQVTVLGWTAAFSVLFAGITLTNAPTWPVAFGVTAIAITGAFVFSIIFKRG